METAIKPRRKASPGSATGTVPDRTGRRGLIFDIKRFALHDGPGIRTTVFFKGCALKCAWCHNPESQLPECELTKREITLDGQIFRDDEIVGTWMTVEDVMNELRKETVFHEESGGGVTFSGGEPLMQPEFLKALLLASGGEGFHRTLDTCGHAARPVIESVADDVDLFLYDLKLMDDKQHREYTGVSNRPILENLKAIVARQKEVIIRLPIVPGITDTDENVSALKNLMRSLSLRRVDLLAYHALGERKYHKLNREIPLANLKTPTDERMTQLKAGFERDDFEVRIGG